jgi:hypothetical protein
MKRALWLWGLIAAIGIVTWIGYVGLQVRGERPADGVVDLIGLAGLAARARYEELKARLNGGGVIDDDYSVILDG